MPKHTNTIVLGAGKLYFDIENSSGVKLGERYLGDTPGFEVSVNTEQTDVWDNDGAIAEKLLSSATRVVRTSTINCQDISMDNLALFLLGAKSTRAQAATPVVDEAINNVLQGRYYQLGALATNPTGVRNVGSVTITDDVPSPAFVLNTDYELDVANGRIYIIEGGGISDGTNLLADYTPVANSREQVITDNLGAKYGALRYIADNTDGENKDLYGPRVQLKPNGSMAMKSRDDTMAIAFETEFLKSGTFEALYIDGVAA